MLLGLAQLGRGAVPPDEPVLRADDEGVLRGRAVFETLRVYDGRSFALHPHFDRLTASAARLQLPPPPLGELQSLAHEALAAAGEPDCVLRFLWTPDTGLALVSALPPDLEELRARGLRLAVQEWPATAVAGAKSTSCAANMAAQAAALARGCDDALLVSPDGVVLEAPTANVWFREGDRLCTPTLELPILAGVTRAVLLQGEEVEEGVFELERLLAADEVFLTSSVREVMPVVSVGGARFARGPAAARLQQALRRYAGEP
ncbi:MAG TPA: aminotransferase class IV [Gaiellaceae bacterium]|nr:aminotransferase class IV [Gaiellaceae bacterium]